MPNCRRRFATEAEVKKHIDNHMNPHSSKSRRLNQMNNASAAAAAAAAAAASVNANTSLDGSKTAFQLSMDKQNNLIPRMGPAIKHELYFPQCYAPPFNQTFGTGQQQTHGSSVTNATGSNPPVNSVNSTSGTTVTSTIPPPTVAQ